jgi:hypothetical protein
MDVSKKIFKKQGTFMTNIKHLSLKIGQKCVVCDHPKNSCARSHIARTRSKAYRTHHGNSPFAEKWRIAIYLGFIYRQVGISAHPLLALSLHKDWQVKLESAYSFKLKCPIIYVHFQC